MPESNESERRFKGVVQAAARGGGFIALPFNPADVWRERERYHVAGTVGGMRIRGPLGRDGEAYQVVLGPAWLRDCPIRPGDEVEVVLWPEGAQLDGLDGDIAAALEAEPDAARFFESLAQFYRKAYLTWLDGAKRRPEVRQQRLREFVELLKAGRKSR